MIPFDHSKDFANYLNNSILYVIKNIYRRKRYSVVVYGKPLQTAMYDNYHRSHDHLKLIVEGRTYFAFGHIMVQ